MLEMSRVAFAYDTEAVVQDFSMSVSRAEIIALLGPSGCGKSTLLRLIAGLQKPTSGQIHMSNAMSHTVGMLFQDFDAYPWLTVWDNVERGSGPKPYPTRTAVDDALIAVGLDNHTKKYPAELSGGMRKRLAIARCIVRRPGILLLDEPFASLDLAARFDMYALLQKVACASESQVGCSVILVTHDIQEAILLADRILVLTPRPMHLRQEIVVSFPRARATANIGTPEFASIESQLYRLIDPRRLTGAAETG